MLRASGETRGIILALNASGAAAAREGDYATAEPIFTEALELAREARDLDLKALSLDNLASVAQVMGLHQQAEDYYRESLLLSREAGNESQVALNLNNLGSLVLSAQGPGEAAPLLTEGLELARRLGLNRMVPFFLANLGLVAYHFGKYDHARARYLEALDLIRDGGEAWLESAMLIQLGRTALDQGQFEDARIHLIDGLRAAWDIQDLPMTLQALTRLAELDIKRERLDEVPELLALTLAHPATQQGDREFAATLATRLSLPSTTPSDDRPASRLGTVVRRVLGASTDLAVGNLAAMKGRQ